MNDKKYIFFDIDGTILNSDAKIPDSTKKALKMAQDNGHEIFINTGRCRPIIPNELVALNFDGYICGTGTYAEYKEELMFEKSFNEDQVNRVVDITMKYKIPIVMSTFHECVASVEDMKKYAEYFSKGNFDINDFKSLEDLQKSPLMQTWHPFFFDDDKTNYFNKYKCISDFIYIQSPFNINEFRKMFGTDINVEKASFKEPDEYSGEITLAECTKSTGIHKLLSMIGADIKDSIAVGDGYNDVNMLKGVSLSIAMGNSPDDVKEIADYVTDDINEDGVFNALKYFDLI